MVALPIAFEQPATGARLERVGAARVLHRRRTPARIRDAIREVLGDPSYRTNARGLQAEIASAGGVRRAADILEARLA
jgi:UDP:flavonoid glycosyltransferase YjiC (YdhE family)